MDVSAIDNAIGCALSKLHAVLRDQIFPNESRDKFLPMGMMCLLPFLQGVVSHSVSGSTLGCLIP